MKNIKNTSSVTAKNSKNLSGIYKILKEKLFNRIQGRFLFSKEGQENNLKTKDYKLKRPVFKKTGLNLGFTLVELIVVITILTILGTIAFISFGSYSSNARDSNRITNVSSIDKGIAINIAAGKNINTFDTLTGANIVIVGSGGTISFTGFYDNIGTKFLTSIGVSGDGLLNDSFQTYKYTYLPDNKFYQVSATLENQPGSAWIENRIYESENEGIVLIISEYLQKTFGIQNKYNFLNSDHLSWIPTFVGMTEDVRITDFLNSQLSVLNSGYAATSNSGYAWVKGNFPVNSASGGYIAGIIPADDNEFKSLTPNPDGTRSISGTGSDVAVSSAIVVSGGNSTPTYSDCTFNSVSVPHSTSVTAYLTNSVAFGSTCTSEQRTCNNGVLSGTYTYSGCTVAGAVGTFSLSSASVTQGTPVTITNDCSTAPTSYTSSNTAVATIAGDTITTITAGTTNITPVGGNCSDSAAKTLTVTAPPIIQWKDIAGTNCTNDDYVFTLAGTTYRWAGCNSVLGTSGISTNAEVYNGTCYNYAGGTVTCTNMNYTDKETSYNSSVGEDNIWGKLYLRANAVQANNACPTGWHVPTDTEFEKLETYLNGGTNCRNATDGWLCDGLGWSVKSSKNSTNNIIKALKLPLAGYRNSGTFNYRGYDAILWSSSEYDSSNARGRLLSRSSSSVVRSYRGKSNNGFSVRCLKDY